MPPWSPHQSRARGRGRAAQCVFPLGLTLVSIPCCGFAARPTAYAGQCQSKQDMRTGGIASMQQCHVVCMADAERPHNDESLLHYCSKFTSCGRVLGSGSVRRQSSTTKTTLHPTASRRPPLPTAAMELLATGRRRRCQQRCRCTIGRGFHTPTLLRGTPQLSSRLMTSTCSRRCGEPDLNLLRAWVSSPPCDANRC